MNKRPVSTDAQALGAFIKASGDLFGRPIERVVADKFGWAPARTHEALGELERNRKVAVHRYGRDPARIYAITLPGSGWDPTGDFDFMQCKTRDLLARRGGTLESEDCAASIADELGTSPGFAAEIIEFLEHEGAVKLTRKSGKAVVAISQRR